MEKMKVLNLHGNKNGLYNQEKKTVRGGLEKVVLELHDLLNSGGVECYTSCSIEDGLEGKNYIPLLPNFGDPAWKSHTRYKVVVDSIINFVVEKEITHIILHGSGRLAKKLSERGIPYVYIDHQQHISINKLYHQSHFRDTIPLGRKHGSKYFSVSLNTKTLIEEEVKKQNLAENFEFDGYIKFQHLTEELNNLKPLMSNGKLITIGRAAPDKKPHLAFKVSKEMNVDLNVFCLYNKTVESENKYYKRHMENKKGVYYNAKRSNMLKVLCSSSLYISTCDTESAGITAFEALACGVPVLLLTNKDNHASEMFAPNNKYMKCMSIKNLDIKWIKEMLSLSFNERKEISKEIKEFNTSDKVLNNIIKVFDELDNINIERGGFFEI